MSTIFDPNQTPSASIGYQNIPNILDNGGFEIWQRGNTFTNPATGAYTADRWKHDHSSGVMSAAISRESTIKDSGAFSLKIDITSVTSGTAYSVFQYIEFSPALSGKILSVSARVRTNVANKIRLSLSDSTGVSYSSYHTGDGTFQTLTVTRTIAANQATSDVYVAVGFQADTVVVSTTYVDAVMLIIGSTPIPFIPANPQVDLARCQRYYEIWGANSQPIPGVPYNNAAGTLGVVDMFISYKVTKRINPVLVVTKTQIVTNAIAPNAPASITDTANWTPVDNANSIDGASIQWQRTGVVSTTRVAGFQFTFTASADL